MLNEFAAKKLGEVLAFSEIGAETMDKGKEALSVVFGVNEVQNMIDSLNKQGQDLRVYVKKMGVEDITLNKLSSTGGKLRQMRDLYVGDEWDNATELMEWSGFFEGAAIVHWDLVVGVADGMADETLTNIANVGHKLHRDILEAVEEKIKLVGKERSVTS